MKRTLLLIICALTFMLPVTAQSPFDFIKKEIQDYKERKAQRKRDKEYYPGKPFPAGGYDLNFFELKKFEDSDSVYYIKIHEYREPERNFWYLIVSQAQADHILAYGVSKEINIKWGDRYDWALAYLDTLGFHKPRNESEWTYFEPKRDYSHGPIVGEKRWQKLTLPLARSTYYKQRGLNPDGTKKKELSVEQWALLFKAVGMVLPMMGDDYETPQEKAVYRSAGRGY